MTGRPFTAMTAMQEPAFSSIVSAGKSTGDSYIIDFSTNKAGGACVFSGQSRYFIENGGDLTFQIAAQCGDLRRGYNFRVCRLDGDLRCAEAPWWYFTGRVYSVTAQGVVVNGTLYPWDNPAQASENLQKIVAEIQKFKATYANPNAPDTMHRRFISCRNYHPEMKTYSISEEMTGCVFKSLCDASKMPDITAMRDGDAVDWNSPLGSYIKQDKKITDVSNWVCWLRTQ